MGMIDFSKMEISNSGGDFLKSPAGETQQVYVLAGPAMIQNKFNTAVPKPALAIWNVRENKVQIMDLKASVFDVLRMLDADHVDWSKILLKIHRKGAGKEDTTYTCLATPCSASLPDYEKRSAEGNAMLQKLALAKSATSEKLDDAQGY